MKPFSHNGNLSEDQKSYNYHQSRACIVVENIFGRLKARWCRLVKRLDMDVEKIPVVVTACCILHNMCVIYGDTSKDTWLDDLISSDNTEHQLNPNFCDDETETTGPKQIRSALVKHFSNTEETQ